VPVVSEPLVVLAPAGSVPRARNVIAVPVTAARGRTQLVVKFFMALIDSRREWP
jgi:hypothetical protein